MGNPTYAGGLAADIITQLQAMAGTTATVTNSVGVGSSTVYTGATNGYEVTYTDNSNTGNIYLDEGIAGAAGTGYALFKFGDQIATPSGTKPSGSLNINAPASVKFKVKVW